MKKLIPILLAMFLLTGCSAQQAALESTRQDETEGPAETQAPAEDETMTEQKTDSSVVMSDECVTMDGIGSYLRMPLPEGWSWTEGESVGEQKVLLLHAPTDDGFEVTIYWWESFAMCGTGVEFREVELGNGIKATLATENSGDMVWWTLILPPSPDQFTLRIDAPQRLIDAHQAELDAMLSGLQIGVLAHTTTVQPQLTDK